MTSPTHDGTPYAYIIISIISFMVIFGSMSLIPNDITAFLIIEFVSIPTFIYTATKVTIWESKR